jgi:hypothetical protein
VGTLLLPLVRSPPVRVVLTLLLRIAAAIGRYASSTIWDSQV